MPVRKLFDKPDELVPERVKARYRVSLKKEDGTALAAAELVTLTLTIRAMDAARTIINSVNAVNILNTGRGTVDAAGLLTIVLLPADNQILDTTLPEERHTMLIQGTYGATGETRHEAILIVVNIHGVPVVP